MKKIGFVIPVFNSSLSLIQLFERIRQVANQMQTSYQIVFIDDKSADNSWSTLISIKEKEPENITILRMGRNCGQHNALLCGFNYCETELIVTLDDDLQTPPEETYKLLKYIKETDSDLVYGVYPSKKHSLIRNIGSNLVQYIFSYVFKTKGSISSFRIFTNDMKMKILKYRTGFTFIDGFLHWETTNIGRVEVEHHKREHGRSGYTLKKLLALSFNLIFNFTTLPLSLTIYAGIFCSLISFLLGILFLVRRIIYDVPLGYTSIIVSIFFSTGVILTVIGFIGEYVRRLYLVNLQAPIFLIQEIRK